MNNFENFFTFFSNLQNTAYFESIFSKYLLSLIIIILVLVFKNFIKKLMLKNVKFLIKNTSLSENISDSIERPLGFFILILGFFFASNILESEGKVEIFFEKIN